MSPVARPSPDRSAARRPLLREVALGGWVLLLAVVMLGPALLPGYVLSYDMVWVPDLTLTRDALGVGSGLPRAVPSDAVVAVLDEVVPGMLLQKVVLLGALAAGGYGLTRLLPRDQALARVVAATAYTWNPLVVERLVIGHWPLLLGYAVAPWLVLAVREWHRTDRVPSRLWWLLPLASLSASTGVLSGVLVLALAARRRTRRWTQLAVLGVVANAPWLVSGLLHASTAGSDPAAPAVFALQDEGEVPGPLAALTLGGIWNSQVVPESRTGVTGWIALVVLTGVAVVGLGRLRSTLSARLWWGLVGCWVLGWLLATATWLDAELLGALAAAPGGGLLRDGARGLVLCAPVLCLALGTGASRVVEAFPAPARLGARVGAVALPIALLPGVAWGAGGRLEAVAYPDDFAAARTALRAADLGGEVLVLPFSSYRAPSWNSGRPVLDPTGRYLGVDVVSSDRLVVGERVLRGEDPRVPRVEALLEDPSARMSSEAWRGLGVGAAVVSRDAGATPDVGGVPLLETELLSVLRLQGDGEGPPARAVPTSWVVAMAGAWAGFVLPPLVAAARSAGRLDLWGRRRRVE